MRFKFFYVAFSFFLCGAAAAHSTPLLFNVSGIVTGTRYAYPYGPQTGAFSGTITFDSLTYNAIAASISVRPTGIAGPFAAYFDFVNHSIPAVTAVPPPPYDPTAAPSDYSLVRNGFTIVQILSPSFAGGGDDLNFTVSDALLTSPTGDSFTSGGIQAYKSTSGNYLISGGLLTPADTVAATPEPSSMILLSTGVLALMGTLRRNYRQLRRARLRSKQRCSF